MTTLQIWITLSAALISGLGGALLSTVVYVRRENRLFKMETLKRFVANRYDLNSPEFKRALNEIVIAFNDSPEVLGVLSEFHESVVSGQGEEIKQNKLVDLFKAMCDAAKVNREQFNDSFFLIPFNARQTGIQQGNAQEHRQAP